MALVDVVIVSHQSRALLPDCVAPLAELADVQVLVVDNASTDGGTASLAGLDVEIIELRENRGFSAGCNAGWKSGAAPYVLFLNPDAQIDEPALRRLVRALEQTPQAGVAGPRIVGPDGALEFSQGRFPSVSRTYARVLFLHRLLPNASWTDIFVRDERAYERGGSCDWATGACLLVRRCVLEAIGGFDERFFLYCEDIDLCRRLRHAGWSVLYEPEAFAVHNGSWEARAERLPYLAASRIAYARKHDGRLAGGLQTIGVRLEALTRLLVSRGGLPARLGHARSLTATPRLGR